MKKIMMALILGASASLSFAAGSEIDLTNTHVTCGKYVFTPATTESEVTKNCKMIEMENKKHLVRANKTELKFATDQYQVVECDFKKGVLAECDIKKK